MRACVFAVWLLCAPSAMSAVCARAGVHACVRACVCSCSCVRACVHACVRANVRVRARACVRACACVVCACVQCVCVFSLHSCCERVKGLKELKDENGFIHVN